MGKSLFTRLKTRRVLIARFGVMLVVEAIIAVLVFAFRPQAQAAPSKPVQPGNPPTDAPETSGGPDNVGYTFLDSNEPGGPTYDWEEISGTGTLATGWDNYDDGHAGPFPIGFSFDYYGNAYSELYIGTNGYLSFGQGFGSIPSGYLPDTNWPNNDIALFGGDMYLSNYGSNSAVYYATLSNPTRFVIQYDNLYYCCSQNTPHTFQVILYPNGDIQAQYASLFGTSTSYVGIENSTGNDGLSYFSSLGDNLAIRYYYPSGVFLEPAVQTGVAEVGTTATYTVSLKNQTGAADNFTLSLQPGNTWTTTLPITQTGTINDGETIFFNVAVDVPPSAAAGDLDEAIIQATSVTSPTITDTASLSTVIGGELAYVVMPEWDYVAMVEPFTLTYINQIDLTTVCDRPTKAAIPPDGETIWVICEYDSSNIVVIDRATHEILTHFTPFMTPAGITFSQNGDYAFVHGIYTNPIVVVDTETYFFTQISVLTWIRDTVAHPYLPLLYVSQPYLNEITVIDTISLDIVDAIQTSRPPASLAISPDGGRLYAGAFNGRYVMAIDTLTNQEIGETPALSDYADAIEVSNDGNHLFMTQYTGQLAVVDAATLEIEQYITLDPNNHFSGPSSLDLTCNGETLLVTNSQNASDMNSRQVAAVDAETYDVLALLAMPDSNGSGYPDWGAYDVAVCPQQVLDGVILQPQNQTQTGGLGEVVTHQATLYNQTGATDSFTVTLGSHIWDTALDQTVIGPVAHGDSITVTVYVTVPLDADWYGTDTVDLTAASVTSPTLYSNTATMTTEAFAPPQISQTPDGLSAILQVGDAVTQSMTVANGNGLTLTFQITETNAAQSLLEMVPEDNHLDGVVILYDRTHDQSSLADLTLRDSLVAAGATVEENWAYPVNADVLADVDVLWLAISSMSEWAAEEIEAVQAWLEAGGGLFLEGVEFGNDAAPLANLVGVTYLPIDLPDQLTDGILPHPTTDGVNEVYARSTYYQLGVTDPAEVVVTVPDPYPGPPDSHNHIAAAEQNLGKAVVLAGHDLNEFAISQADNLTLGENIFAWLASPSFVDFPWLRESPTSGTVTANSSQAIAVTFDAAGIQPGEYRANLRTDSNDPDDRSVTLPVTLTVQPTASMGWVEGTVSDANSGDPLAATLMALDEPYVINSDPDTGYYKLWLEPGNYTLEAAAEGYVTDTAAINITTQQGTSQDIALVANVPVVNPSPDSFSVEQEVGDITVETLTIENAGPAELTFELSEQPDGGNPARDQGATVLIIQDNYPWGHSSIQQVLYSLDINYHQIASWEMSFADLSAYELVIVPSDQNIFFFDNWEAHYDKVESYLLGGGALWLSITGDLGFIPIPGGVSYDWDMSTYNSVVAGAHPWVNSVPTIIFGNPASLTEFTYLAPGSQVVVQSQDSGNATLVDYNYGPGRVFLSGMGLEYEWVLNGHAAPIIANALADLYAWTPEVSWLSLSPTAGSVPGYDAQDVEVTLDATGLQPGDYQANIGMMTNDPATPLLVIPVSMNVAPTANMGRVIGTVTDAWSGQPLTASVQLVGVHTGLADPTYAIWADAGSYTLMASAPGYATDTASVNITAGATQVVNFALEPAQARLEWSPGAIEATAGEEHSVQQTLLISNTGPMPLDFSLHELAPMLPNGDGRSGLEEVHIMYDSSHGEYPPYYFTVLLGDLVDAGAFVSENFSYPITTDMLAQFDVLWVTCCGPTSWTSSELSAISSWLADGGSIFIHGGGSDSTITLASYFGIDYVSGNCTGGLSSQIELHAITSGVDSVDVPSACNQLSSTTAETVVFTQQGEHHVQVYDQDGGKIVVVADDDFLDWQIGYGDNRILANNIFSWLAAPAYGDVPWLSVDPDIGSVPGHEETAVTVTLDAAGLAPGVYEATLVVEHNDPAQPQPLYLPVTFEVIASEPAVTLSSNQSQSAVVGSAVVYNFTVTNVGNMADTFTLSVNSDWDALLSATTTGPLDPGESFNVTLTVQVPYGVPNGSSKIATITAQSSLNQAITDSAEATTTATWLRIALPIIIRR